MNHARVGPPSRSAYNAGCRCDGCRRACAEYQRRRRPPTEPMYCDATDAREHILRLSRQGVGKRAIADACDLNPHTIYEIRRGRRTRIQKTTERRILAITEDARADRSLVPAGRVKAQLRILIDNGWPRKLLSRELGLCDKWLPLYRHTPNVTAATALRVERMVRRIEAGRVSRAGWEPLAG